MSGGGSFTSDQSVAHATADGQMVATGRRARVTYIQATGITNLKLYDAATASGNIVFESTFGSEGLDMYIPGNGIRFQNTIYADVTGSSFTYTPPSGTTQVIYEYHGMHGSDPDIWPIPHFRLYLDSDEVVYQRKTVTANNYFEGQWYYRYAFNIGGTANTNTGRVASWSSDKTIKIQAREYSAGYDAELNTFDHWDGGAGPIFNQPIIGITAIG